jgi:ABC-type transporter Mla subunit MlaD
VKRIWKRKWLVLIATLAIFLSVGAVAWAATEGGTTTETAVATGDRTGVVAAAVCEEDCDQIGRPGPALRKAMRDKAEQWAGRHTKLMEALRGDMSPDDQALYDRLVQTAEQQREALQEARSDLMDTLKQLRDLADKYLDED